MRIPGKVLVAFLAVAAACGITGGGASRGVARGQEAAGPPGPVLAAQLRDGYFHVLREGEWSKIYVAGVDIGPALPGHFPADAPTAAAVYADWLNRIAGMGANAVRVYTLLPSAFYRALLNYNSGHPGAPVYLFQEIWLKDPPRDDLFDASFTADYEKDVRDVVDAIYGRGVPAAGTGQAGDSYGADVSPFVLGWLVGREIEPRVVIATSLQNPGAKSFAGRYLRIADGNPAEVWLTRQCDALIDYETRTYDRQRPVAFVNWPPLDPLPHPTETPPDDEWRMRQALGAQDGRDPVSLDEERISPQPDFQAGYFALYHLYPHYPEFIYLDPDYARAQDKGGPNPYWGYLLDLKKHFQKTPLLVGEYGLSTSVGVAHVNPMGWNHGGLDEAQQGQVLARLTGNIKDAGFAGGIVFEWIDEWWKHSWIAAELKQPVERSPYWHNDMDPEESYGIMKFVPEEPRSYATLASADSSAGRKPRHRGVYSVRALRAAGDYSALYIDLDLDIPPGAQPDWKKSGYLIALNTCGVPCGAGLLPSSGGTHAAFGANFAVLVEAPGEARLLIARSYNPYAELPGKKFSFGGDRILPRYFYPEFDPAGSFEEIQVVVNGGRHSRQGSYFRPVSFNRSLLREGIFEADDPRYDSAAQWYYDGAARRIRLRLPWGLLLVLDPSQGLVFSGTDRQGVPFGKLSSRIQVAAVTLASAGRRKSPVPAQVVAKTVSGDTITEGWSFPWPVWFRVDAQMAPKRSYRILTDVFRNLTGYPEGNTPNAQGRAAPAGD